MQGVRGTGPPFFVSSARFPTGRPASLHDAVETTGELPMDAHFPGRRMSDHAHPQVVGTSCRDGKKVHGISSTIKPCKLYKLCKSHKGRKGIDASGIIEPRLRPEEGSGTSAMRRAPMKSPRAWRASSRSYLGEPLCFFILVHWLLPVNNSV